MQFITRRSKKLLSSWEVMKPCQVANVGSNFVCLDASLAEKVEIVLNYSYTLVEEYVLQFLRAKTEDMV